jgi:hypothetical protein
MLNCAKNVDLTYTVYMAFSRMCRTFSSILASRMNHRNKVLDYMHECQALNGKWHQALIS